LIRAHGLLNARSEKGHKTSMVEGQNNNYNFAEPHQGLEGQMPI